MERSYRLRIYPTKKQLRLLAKYFGTARWVWNACLNYRTHYYQVLKERVTGVDFSRELTQLKKLESYQWLSNTPATILVNTIRNQDQALRNFFAKRARYPNYKKRQSAPTVQFQINQRVAVNYFRSGQLLRLTGLGKIKVVWSRLPSGIPKMVTVSRDVSGHYYASFMCVEDINPLLATNHGLGIDLGITDVLVASDGYKSGNPRHLKQKIRKLKRYQRRLARCQKWSKRRHLAQYRVAKQHVKITNSRNDWLHKQTTALIRRADVIALEDLNVKGMVTNHHLAQAINDVGMGEIRRQLEYKAKWYVREVIIIDRFAPTSKVCAECGYVMNAMTLSIRTWTCPNCGVVHDRDTNAARNILALATSGRLGSYVREGRQPPSASGNSVTGMQASVETRTALSIACEGVRQG